MVDGIIIEIARLSRVKTKKIKRVSGGLWCKWYGLWYMVSSYWSNEFSNKEFQSYK